MKRLISVFLTLLLCFGLQSVSFAEDSLEEKVNYISSLGIMTGYEDGSFREENPITRAEYAAVAVRLAGWADSANVGIYDGRYSDVSADFWGAGYIGLAFAMSLMNGYTDGTFLPERYISYNEAIKVMVCLLGYGWRAERVGGYPSGYLSVASQLGLMAFESYEASAPISRGEIVRMIDKALKVEVMVVEGIDAEGETILSNGGTVLKELLSSVMYRGTVTATEIDSLNGKSLARGYVEIDNKRYKTDLNCNGFLGERVKYVLKEEEDEEKLVYIASEPSTEKITVFAEDVIDAEGIFTSNGSLRYWDEGMNAEEISFGANVIVIYNNKVLAYEDAGSIDFAKTPDIYECFDRDKDGAYDLLKLKAFEDYSVKKVYTDDDVRTVVTDNNVTVKYDPNDDDVFLSAALDGEAVSFEEISEGDVISVAKSLDSFVYEIIISRNSLEGTVTGRTEEDGAVILTIDDTEYRVSDTLSARHREPGLGDSGVFYLSYRDEIAYYEGTETSDGFYGFLTAVESDGGLGENCRIKILDTDNVFREYPIADKITFSKQGVSTTVNAKDIVAYFKADKDADGDGIGDTWFDMRTAKTQIVRYKLNENGELKYIATAKETPDTQSFSVAAPNRKYYYSNGLFEQKWKITSSTVVFYIPSTKQGEDYTRYRVGNAAKYFANGNTYQTELYDVDENGEVGAVFYSLTGQAQEITYSVDAASCKVMIIDKVSRKADEEGNTRCVVSGIVDGNYTSVYVSEDFLSSASDKNMLKFGNVIQYQTNSSTVQAAYYNGEPTELVKANLLCNFNTTAMRKLYNGSAVEQRSPKITTVYGTVSRIDDSKVTIALQDGEETEVFLADTQTVIRIEGSKNIDTGSFYDIQPGQKIFVRMRYDRIKDVVIQH